MTDHSDIAALKELALKAKEQVYPIDLPKNTAVVTDVWEYTKAASPDVVLSLIEKIEMAEARIKKLEDALMFLQTANVGGPYVQEKIKEALKEK